MKFARLPKAKFKKPPAPRILRVGNTYHGAKFAKNLTPDRRFAVANT
jgi:hypothetical protein